MSNFEITRSESVGYNEHGQSVRSSETYIKILAEFKTQLFEFKGARLSAFLCLACNESEISFGHSMGLSVYDVATNTGYKVRATLYALQFLCERNFATKLEQCGEKGESLYRVSAYAWFGNPRVDPPSSRGYAKNAHPKCTPVHSSAQTSSRSTQDSLLLESKDQTTPNYAEIEQILREAGLRTQDLNLRSMTETRAQEVAQWISDNSEQKRSPAGYAYTLLRANPNWRPPVRQRTVQDEIHEAALRTQAREDLECEPEQADSPRSIGHGLLKAMKGQLEGTMTRATFDQCVRGIQFVSFDPEAKVLCLQPQSVYAREWLEARLAPTIGRAVDSAAEDHIELRYQMREEDECVAVR